MTETGRRIRILAGEVEARAGLNDGPTADRIWDALPIEAKANRWGEEIYFSIPVECPAEADARVEMAVGEIAYWPPGSAFCIFFGPTPASEGNVPGGGDAPRAASDVNPLGRVEGDATRFTRVPDGAPVTLERA
ncbi:MAG: cyclophilin-like fold protein [Nitrospinota bacterium]|nr:cyclophilin-like fold protein [Nitrospinota bacterium]